MYQGVHNLALPLSSPALLFISFDIFYSIIIYMLICIYLVVQTMYLDIKFWVQLAKFKMYSLSKVIFNIWLNNKLTTIQQKVCYVN